MDKFDKRVFVALVVIAVLSAVNVAGLVWIGAWWGAAGWFFNFTFATVGATLVWRYR
jgi:hypothetical protein